MNIEDIPSGEHWACKFRVNVMLDENGKPVSGAIVGQTYPGPGDYEGIGVITTRDLDKRLVEVLDVDSEKTFIVSFDDCWDFDTVEFTEE